jgi:phosphoenolpyruvate synthase/pyruvate phosphate dikinase
MSLYTEEIAKSEASKNNEIFVLTNERLTKIFFDQFSGVLANIPFVKFIIDRNDNNKIYFLNDRFYHLHAFFVADHITEESHEDFFKNIDEFNAFNYHSDDRRFYFGTIGRIKKENKTIYLLETQEIDSMREKLIEELFSIVKKNLDPNFELIFKPANHIQESSMESISVKKIPRMLTTEIYATSNFISLNSGFAIGRIRAFHSEGEYHKFQDTIEWYDIVVMKRVPDDVPRVSGIINAEFTTPLSHTNVLASGWKIPNCIQKNIFEKIEKEFLDGEWVSYEVSPKENHALIAKTSAPVDLKKPNWTMQAVVLENPDIEDTKICSLDKLRMTDAYKYGTKAANIGEMKHLLKKGSNRLLGFYQVKRPPRENLLSHLAHFLGVEDLENIQDKAEQFLFDFVKVPNGIAIPFSIQRQFLETSPQIQQGIGKLKMALELDAHEIDSLCVSLQNLILKTRMPDVIRDEIDKMIIKELAGVSTFVVRSSSNAEDLENFSAAGIYESVNHLKTSDQIFDAIKVVWASLVSARSVRLRQQSGISLDQSYMGVIIQEEVSSGMGGVMVTTNPMDKADFRNTYINVSLKSVINIVQGAELPMQYLYNTVESGGYTLSLGSAEEDLSSERRAILQKMAYAGRLMQSHFSPDYTFSCPVDIEWLVNHDGLHFLQLRPYSK